MPTKKLKEFLDSHHVKYVSIQHSAAFTAQEVAESTHIPGRYMAKTVIIKVENNRFIMVVLPANRKVIITELREMLGFEKASFATEDEFKSLFPDCELGAMPPFGNLYDMDVFVSPGIVEDDFIIFNAGTHTEAIKMSYRSYEALVKPKVLSFTT